VIPVQQSDFASERECLSLLQCCHLQNTQYKLYNDKEHRITDTQFKKHKSYMGKTEIAYIGSTALGLSLGNVWSVPQAGHAAP
jgi:hypothetical protein